MRCPKCGNEVSQDEVFCGQCGTPVTLPAGATDMVNTPSPRNGLLGSYNANMLNNPNYSNVPPVMPQGQGSYPPQMPPSNAYNNATIPVPPSGPLAPDQQQSQQLRQPMGPQQQSGFYQDATEAIVSVPQNNSPLYPPGYQQQQQQQQPGFTGNAGQSGYVGGSQYGTQGLYPTPNFPATNYPASATPPGQGYGYSTPPGPTPPPKKQPSALFVFAIVCLIVAIITVGAFGLIYLLRNHPSHTTTASTAIPTPAVTPTTAPSPTPSPTALATATPTPVPSPTVPPTPTPDLNFAWCSSCTSNGFLVEYPQGWNQINDGSPMNVRFFNPIVNDQYAEFKTPGATSSSASELVTNDLQTTYASLPGYTAPTSSSTATIGGENWTYETASYQLNGQTEQVVVYATVHQQKGYIIELQAAADQFATVNTQYFSVMLNRFQFQ
jgi:zinc-ribbon domain